MKKIKFATVYVVKEACKDILVLMYCTVISVCISDRFNFTRNSYLFKLGQLQFKNASTRQMPNFLRQNLNTKQVPQTVHHAHWHSTLIQSRSSYIISVNSFWIIIIPLLTWIILVLFKYRKILTVSINELSLIFMASKSCNPCVWTPYPSPADTCQATHRSQFSLLLPKRTPCCRTVLCCYRNGRILKTDSFITTGASFTVHTYYKSSPGFPTSMPKLNYTCCSPEPPGKGLE